VAGLLEPNKLDAITLTRSWLVARRGCRRHWWSTWSRDI